MRRKIIAQNGAGTTYAAGLARVYTGGGYSDWCLPSRDDLYQLYLNRAAIGGFPGGARYWSSSEVESIANGAWGQDFGDGYQSNDGKASSSRVRAVRAF